MDGTLKLILLHAGLIAYAVSTGVGVLALRREDRKLLRFAKAALLPGILAHGTLILLIGLHEQRFPVATLQEAFLFLAVVLCIVVLSLDALRSMPVLSIGVAPVATIVGVLAATLGPSKPRPESQEFLIGVHVVITLIAFAAFALAFVSSVLFLAEQRRLKQHSKPSLIELMPSLEGLYGMILTWVSLGLFLLTAGILSGYLFMRGIDPGRGWRMDPKIIMTSLTWLAYAIVMILSLIPACKGRRTAIGATICFFLVAATFWGSVFWSEFHKTV